MLSKFMFVYNHFLILIFFTPTLISSNKREFTYLVNEEADNNTFVGNILLDSGLQDKVTKEDFGIQLYEDQATGLFRVDRHSGKLLVNKRIDREAICPQRNLVSFMSPPPTHLSGRNVYLGLERTQGEDAACQVEFSAHIPPEYWVNVIVIIKDINDHAPKFQEGNSNPNMIGLTKSPYVLHISEGVNVAYQVPLVGAIDEDYGENGVQTYTLSGKDLDKSTFSINFNPPYELNLVVLRKLDYETKTSYSGVLTACDGGKPKPLCATQFINIFVTDINDNIPVFNQQLYELRISENTTVGSVVTSVLATDADSREFGRIKYHIGQIYDQNVHRYFEVKEDTGEVRVKYPLQANLVPRVRIPILAQDGGLIPKTGSTMLQIDVDDINDHAPWIEIKPIISPTSHNPPQQPANSGRIQLWLEENQPIGTQIAIVVSGDRDVGANGDVNCVLQGNTSLFQLRHSNSARERKIYSLQSNYKFDLEEMHSPKIKIDIECADAGSPRMVVLNTIQIEILDINEYPAHFNENNMNYVVFLPEDVSPGSMVIQVEATDRDATAVMHFTLSEEAQQYFRIEERTGKIYTSQHLDREQANEIRFAVRVFDDDFLEQPQRFSVDYRGSDIANITVVLGDVNDNSPKLQGRRSFQVLENRPAYSDVIGQLVASDEDAGENGTVHFNIISVSSYPSSQTNLTFDINAVSGKIYAKVSLDREIVAQYTIKVEITDLGRPFPKQIKETILIEVLDENDNKPTWQTPQQLDSSVSVHRVVNVVTGSSNYVDRNDLKCLGFVNASEFTSVYSPLLTLIATDLDDKRNANLTFHIISLNYFGDKFQLTGDNVINLLSPPKQLNFSEFFIIDQHIWTLNLVPERSIHRGLHELLLRVSDNGNPPLHSDIFLYVYENRLMDATLGDIVGNFLAEWGGRKFIIFIILGCLIICFPLLLIFLIMLRRRRNVSRERASIISPNGHFHYRGDLVEKKNSLPKVFAAQDRGEIGGDVEGWARGQYYLTAHHWMTSPANEYVSHTNNIAPEMSTSITRGTPGNLFPDSEMRHLLPLINNTVLDRLDGNKSGLIQRHQMCPVSSNLEQSGPMTRFPVSSIQMDLDVGSADSGHGASEEETNNLDSRKPFRGLLVKKGFRQVSNSVGGISTFSSYSGAAREDNMITSNRHVLGGANQIHHLHYSTLAEFENDLFEKTRKVEGELMDVAYPGPYPRGQTTENYNLDNKASLLPIKFAFQRPTSEHRLVEDVDIQPPHPSLI